jgi:hypothetical protein
VYAPFTCITVKTNGRRLGSLVFFLNGYRSGGPIINNQISTNIEKCLVMPGKQITQQGK